jgi:asparagine synthase (glutamine-hydrolysing)
MCGIYLTNIPASEDDVVEKLHSIQFRGPDNLRVKQFDNIILGHLRLSILDLDKRSDQPMSFDGISITFNGEIYNYLDIKCELTELGYVFNTTSDTEVLLCGYKQWGAGILNKINGMFAFCIYDAINQRIFGARDRLGVKPFYYYWKDGQFEICSQLRPLSKNKELCAEAISIFLECSYIPSPYSIFKDIFKLPPGNYIEIDLKSKSFALTEYWNLKKTEIRSISYEDAKAELHELLKDSVKIRLQSDVPIGAFLSGGVDSALVSSIASKLSKEPINTFTVGFDQVEYDESKVALEYAKTIGSNHKEITCTPKDIMHLIPRFVKVFDEPFADSSALPSLLLNAATKKYVTVALSGDGGDESFLGYNYFTEIEKIKKVFLIPFLIRKALALLLPSNSLKFKASSVKRIIGLKSLSDIIWGVFVGYNSLLKNRRSAWRSRYSFFDSLSDNIIQKAADLNIKLWLENDSNVKVDRASMAYSVEVRSPFLDYRIIEFARNLPVSYRYTIKKKKIILKDILKEYIPETIFDQPKKGFSVPIDHWIRTELKEEFIQNLNDEFLNSVPNLDVPKFKRMIKLHLSGARNYGAYIWRLYVLSKWYQEFGFFSLSNKKDQYSYI